MRNSRYMVVFDGGVLIRNNNFGEDQKGEDKFVDDVLQTFDKDTVLQIIREFGDKKVIYEVKKH